MKKPENLRIIVIDDNASIHQDFLKILTRNKNGQDASDITWLENSIFGDESINDLFPQFEIDTASQGKEGVEKIAQGIKEGRPYALAFVDIRMPPGWDGIETIKHIWEIDSNIQVVICTAYSDYSWEETVNQLGQRDNLLILKKPFDNLAVRQLACALTKKWQLMQEGKEYTISLEDRVQQRTESLYQSLSLMRATLESSADGILVVGNNNKLNDYNNKLLEIFKITITMVDKKDVKSILDHMIEQMSDPAEFIAHTRQLTDGVNDNAIGIIRFNDRRVIEYYTQPYKLNNKSLGRIWSFRDVTKRVSLEDQLHYQATHDLLTGLPNRVLLLDRMRQLLVRAEHNESKFGLLFLDLDRFKLVNDSISHEAGDELLCEVTNRLKSIVRTDDTLARLGGDEFVVLIDDIDTQKNLASLAAKILSAFDEPFKIQSHEVSLSTSIGISIYPTDGTSIDDLLRNADIAMYNAKEFGANQFRVYTQELNIKNKHRLELESELRQALIRDEFFLYYQPQLDLKTEKLVSVEALIRWNHPTKGVVLPLDFIPLAEDTGLIIPIGEWVLRTACKQMKMWQDMGYEPIRVAVNVTTKQFRLYNLVQIIKEILEDTGLDAKYLELELTENIIINNLDIVQTIHDLKNMGIQIVLDDFGTGYSSLNYLRQIPVDRLKIDQSYVQNIESDRGDDVIIQAILAMAKSLNLEVLAEGVETQNQLDFLKSHKCGEVQGFYFSKPVSADDCERLLTEKNEVTKEK